MRVRLDTPPAEPRARARRDAAEPSNAGIALMLVMSATALVMFAATVAL